MEDVIPEFEQFYHEHVTLRGRVVQPGEECRVVFDKLCEHFEMELQGCDDNIKEIESLEERIEYLEEQLSATEQEIEDLMERCENG